MVEKVTEWTGKSITKPRSLARNQKHMQDAGQVQRPYDHT